MIKGSPFPARRPTGALFSALSLAVLASSLQPQPAAAQSVPRGQDVAGRPRPDYDPRGIDVAGVRVYPSLKADLLATDNFRASNTNRQDDIYLVLAPEARLTSSWARHQVSARAYLSRTNHARLTSENVTQYGANAGVALDLSRDGRVNLDVAVDHRSEGRDDLGSFQGTSSPVNYDIYRVDVSGAQTFNRLVLNAQASLERRDFNDVRAGDGSEIDQDFRDVRTASVSASAQYELRSGVSALVSAQFDESDFTASASPGRVRRDSSGYTLLAGVSLELSSLIFGQLQIGTLNRRYDDPSLQDINGISYRANILWNVTPLTSLRLTGSRSVEDAASTSFAGNTRTAIGLTVDHELYRYVIVSIDTKYSHFSANGPGASGDEVSVALATRYLIDRRWSLSGRLRYAQRSSDTPGLRYHSTAATITAGLAF